jgi:hypothetical protein
MSSMGPRAVGLALLLAGCGRLGFDAGDAGVDTPPVRSTLRLDRIAPGEPLDNFPLPVTLDGVDPATLRFFDIDANELAHEIETVGPPLVAWVLVPRIAGTSTQLIVEYGGAPSSQSRVFGTEYAGVWHMAGEGALVDASPHGRDGATTGTRSIRGVVGDARDYMPQDCAVVRAFESLQFPNPVTMTAWLFRAVPLVSGDYDVVITKQDSDTSEDELILGTTGSVYFGGIETNPLGTPVLFGPPPPIAEWHQITYTYDGALAVLYVDGVEVSQGAAGGMTLAGPNPLFIGCGRNMSTTPIYEPDTDFIDGRLDEVRIEAVARSPAWLAYEHAAQRDQVISYE